MLSEAEENQLKEKARNIRKNIISMIARAGSGHPGGSLSCVEILVSLYFKTMKHDPQNPFDPERDRFIMSKGHACPALYAVFAETGYISKEMLLILRRLDSPLQGHLDKRFLPILEASTGSLGQGLSIGLGMALGLRLDKSASRVFVLLGDGECEEGQVWESVMAAAHFKTGNLTAIVDYNKIQLDGFVKDIMGLEPFAAKWEAFGWEVRVIDGHELNEVDVALDGAGKNTDKPLAIIANTIKGKGVSFMENKVEFHGQAPNAEEAEMAIKEIMGQ